jgi:hypothetical protein
VSTSIHGMPARGVAGCSRVTLTTLLTSSFGTFGSFGTRSIDHSRLLTGPLVGRICTRHGELNGMCHHHSIPLASISANAVLSSMASAVSRPWL